MKSIHIEDWKTKIDKEWMPKAQSIELKDIALPEHTQSRSKGIITQAYGDKNSHMEAMIQTVRFHHQCGESPIHTPICVKPLPGSLTHSYQLVLGHHRYRAHKASGLTKIKAVVCTFADARTERKFQKINNSHKDVAARNSKADIVNEIRASAEDMVEDGFHQERDRKEMQSLLMKELPHMFSTYSHASLKTQVNNYFETCDSDGTGKFKSYTSDEAWETARIALGLPDWLKKSTKSDANCNHVILCMKDDANFATYLGYALVAKLNDPKARVHLVTYHKTGRLTSPMELLDKRSKFRGLLKETQTKRTRALKRGVTLIDSHHALPQICGESPLAEEEGVLVDQSYTSY